MTTKRTIRECSVFQLLSDDELEKVLSMAVDKEYEAGDVIFHQGSTADELFVIQEGKVALQMNLSVPLLQMSRSVTVDIQTSNDVLGWSAIVKPQIYTLTAVCLQRVKALAIGGVRLRSLLQDNQHVGHEVLNGLIDVVASRLDETRRLLISERLWFPKLEQDGSLRQVATNLAGK